MKYKIEFAASQAGATETNSPWVTPKTQTYQDLVLKPEYADRKLHLSIGANWLRIVPALQASVHDWLLPVRAIDFPDGRFAHPRTLTKNAKNLFDHAYTWMQKNHPEALYSKANKEGVKLLTYPLAAFWVLVEKVEGREVRLFLGSGYDGSRGGTPGLGYRIWKHCLQRDEQNNLMAEVAHPEKGVLICVEKTQAKGVQYPSYSLKLGRQPAPVDELLASIDAEETCLICPQEQAIRELTLEEQWKCLEKVLPKALFNECKTSL